MMHFIYDSLETVKKIKHPSKKDYINLSIAIFVLLLIAGLFFVLSDTVFTGIYRLFYNIIVS